MAPWQTAFGGPLEAGAELVTAAGLRFLGEAFLLDRGAPAWSVSAGHRLGDGTRVLEGFSGPLGRWEQARCSFRVALEQDAPESAVAALRLGWNAAVQEAGAVLVHASAVSWNGLAAIALGPSGAGKSTFARLCVEAGGTLLSDEIIALHPDGRVAGTPFCSDLHLPGTPGPFRAGILVLLDKGVDEALLPAGGPALVQACLGQLFTPEGAPADRGECFTRLLAFLSRVETRTFRFRKHPSAGEFIRDALAALPLR